MLAGQPSGCVSVRFETKLSPNEGQTDRPASQNRPGQGAAGPKVLQIIFVQYPYCISGCPGYAYVRWLGEARLQGGLLTGGRRRRRRGFKCCQKLPIETTQEEAGAQRCVGANSLVQPRISGVAGRIFENGRSFCLSPLLNPPDYPGDISSHDAFAIDRGLCAAGPEAGTEAWFSWPELAARSALTLPIRKCVARDSRIFANARGIAGSIINRAVIR